MKVIPEAAYAAALASLPDVGPGWLTEVLRGRSPRYVWELLCDPRAAATLPCGRRHLSPDRLPRLAAAARSTDISSLWAMCAGSGITVTWIGNAGHPGSLSQGPAPCGVLFWRGRRPDVAELPAVALVGTRACTPMGAAIARDLAYDLAAAGLCVVSGLALGIDGAAHAGAVDAAKQGRPGAGGTIGVAASGVDVVYPRQHRKLWADVQDSGAIVSETPPGRPAQAWRFPSRNRLIAGLARLVVVVESHIAGGSWHTVEAAMRRGADVGAVPGPVRSPASAGTNKLLFDGALVVRSADDVLGYIGLDTGLDRLSTAAPTLTAGSTPTVAPVVDRVQKALGFVPMTLDEIVERAGLPVAAVAVAMEALHLDGRVGEQGGFWSRL